MYDVAIIGGGVVGALIARRLSGYELKICILEKENDVCMGASKANSAIVHAGFDAPSGTLKARLNVLGSRMMPEICKELGVRFVNNGALVIGFDEKDQATIETLFARGKQNGVKDLKILEKEELCSLAPSVSKNAVLALYAPTSAIICPYDLTIAAVGNAMDNGAELRCNFEVSKIEKIKEGYILSSASDSIKARFVVNCAGLYGDQIAKLIGDTSFSIRARKGEYILLDKDQGDLVFQTVFRTPSHIGKGILVTPTVDGNLLLGPTAIELDEKEDKGTTHSGLQEIMARAGESVEGIDLSKAITSFSGLRAAGSTGDFILRSPEKGFVHAAGIESPGLSASPAIAKYVVEMLSAQGLPLKEKKGYSPFRKSSHAFRDATLEEKNEMIRRDPSYGKIVCRCEGVTEGEILSAIRQNPPARDLDGVKRRTRAQMGRCQGGFCMPYIIELIARDQGIPYEAVIKSGKGSFVNVKERK